MHGPSTLERAFMLARSGEVITIADLIKILRAEGFSSVHQHLSGTAIKAQLRALMVAARPAANASPAANGHDPDPS
jgi:hypothetical protein